MELDPKSEEIFQKIDAAVKDILSQFPNEAPEVIRERLEAYFQSLIECGQIESYDVTKFESPKTPEPTSTPFTVKITDPLFPAKSFAWKMGGAKEEQ